MPIPFSCERCGRTLNVLDELAGRQIYCPDCKSILIVPNWTPPPVEETPTLAPPPADDLEARVEEPAPAETAPSPHEEPRPLPDERTGPHVGAIIVGILLIAAAGVMLYFQLKGGGNPGRGSMRLLIFLFIAGLVAFFKGLSGKIG